MLQDSVTAVVAIAILLNGVSTMDWCHGKMETQVPIFGDPQSPFSWEYEDPFVKMGRLEVINMMVK